MGYPINVTMFEYLLDNGMTRSEYEWFRRSHRKQYCIMGNDYYITNEHLVDGRGEISPSGEIFGYYVITHQYFSRYRLPVMHTETNLGDAEKLLAGFESNGPTFTNSSATMCLSWASLGTASRIRWIGTPRCSKITAM